MADLKITQLTAGTPADTDLHVAVDTTDVTMAPTGTDKKYTWSGLKTDAASTFFTVTATQLLIAAGAGNPPTGDAGLTFATNILTAPTLLLKTALRIEDPGAGTNYVAFVSPVLAGNTTYTLPSVDGVLGEVLTTNGAGTLAWTAGSGGDVVGPGASTNDALVRWDGATGALVQNSVAILSDAGALSGLTQLSVDNIDINGNTISSTDVNGNIVLDPNGTGIVTAPAVINTSVGFRMVETGGGTDTITHVAPGAVTTSYTVIEAGSIPAIGQVPVVAGVGGTNVTMSWTSVATPTETTVTTTWVGIWAAGQSGDIKALTDGNHVVLKIPAVAAVANTAAVATNTGTELSVSLRPATTQVVPIFAITDNAITGLLGNIQIATTGVITISLANAGIAHVQNGGSFAGAGSSGWGAFPVSYYLT